MRFVCPLKSTKRQSVIVKPEECRECYGNQKETTEFCMHMNQYELEYIKEKL